MKKLYNLILSNIQQRLDQIPIFIVGSSHSGTSILLRILSEHPHLYTIKNETRLFYDEDKKIIFTLIKWMLRVKMSGKIGLVEKTPVHIYCIDKIFHYLPNARIICMLRDGRDVAFSMKERHGGTFDAFKHGMGVWFETNSICRNYYPDSRIKLVKLEDLVAEPEKTLISICQFLGIEFYDDILDYHKKTKLFYSDSVDRPDNVLDGEGHLRNRNWQINQKLFDGSGKWKERMSPREKIAFKEKAGRMLIEYGYAEDENW